jgi:hypothetical protein
VVLGPQPDRSRSVPWGLPRPEPGQGWPKATRRAWLDAGGDEVMFDDKTGFMQPRVHPGDTVARAQWTWR